MCAFRISCRVFWFSYTLSAERLHEERTLSMNVFTTSATSILNNLRAPPHISSLPMFFVPATRGPATALRTTATDPVNFPSVAPAARGELRFGMRQTLQGSFSAVSKRNFARKYAFESSRRDLHNALLCTALQSHFFCQNSQFFFGNFDLFRIHFTI